MPAGRCHPCVRYDLSPMSRTAHSAFAVFRILVRRGCHRGEAPLVSMEALPSLRYAALDPAHGRPDLDRTEKPPRDRPRPDSVPPLIAWEILLGLNWRGASCRGLPCREHVPTGHRPNSPSRRPPGSPAPRLAARTRDQQRQIPVDVAIAPWSRSAAGYSGWTGSAIRHVGRWSASMTPPTKRFCGFSRWIAKRCSICRSG
jgi:hypothetical protein